MSEKHCDGCGDEFPSDMMFEGLGNDKFFCAWCLGFEPEVNQPATDDLTPEQVEELFWKNTHTK